MNESKIQMISGNTTPQVFCAKLMEVSDDIKHIACVVAYKNGETHVFNTVMPNVDLAWLRYVFIEEFKENEDE